jgi:transposase-like protein/IS1 family transposase
MTCARCQHTEVKKFGVYGRKKIQRFRCKSCGSTFSFPHPKPLGNRYIDLSEAVHVLSLLLEGMSIRAASRITGMHKRTILSLLVAAGQKCQSVLDARIQNLRPKFVQLDELWTFVFKKEAHLQHDDPAEWGDAYTWVGLDADTKLIISHLVAKRDGPSALEFVTDLSKRVVGRLQVTSDGFRPYIGAMEECFGADVDFAKLLKIYGKPDNAGPDWYGPPKVIETVPTPVSGKPDFAHICTSHVERSNLNFRMHLRRFTRLVNGFSKKLANLKAAVALYVAWYNLCRLHMTLRVTPAMQAGITDHIWDLGELLAA